MEPLCPCRIYVCVHLCVYVFVQFMCMCFGIKTASTNLLLLKAGRRGRDAPQRGRGNTKEGAGESIGYKACRTHLCRKLIGTDSYRFKVSLFYNRAAFQLMEVLLEVPLDWRMYQACTPGRLPDRP